MTWNSFIYFALPALLLWLGGAWTAWKKRPIPTYLFTVAGLLVYFAFILGMWFSLERPPLRTMGETRLWYAFFLPTAGLIIYSRWRYPWILAFSTLLAGVFTTINLVNPEIHNKTLMHLVWCTLGERGLGTLLGLGPERNLGSCHLVCLFGVYPCAFARRSLSSCGTMGIDCFFRAAADVLVGHQLFAFSTRSKRAHL